jgi:hypothetical protein
MPVSLRRLRLGRVNSSLIPTHPRWSYTWTYISYLGLSNTEERVLNACYNYQLHSRGYVRSSASPRAGRRAALCGWS